MTFRAGKMIEHPVIAALRRNGTIEQNCHERRCEICGEEVGELTVVYEDNAAWMIGCESCITFELAEEDGFCEECGAEVPEGERLYYDEGEQIGCQECIKMKRSFD